MPANDFMRKRKTIIIVEDDIGHAGLIIKNLKRSSVKDEIIHFSNGEKVLDFLFDEDCPCREDKVSCIMLLDIRMPKIDGIEVLRKIKDNNNTMLIPVIMVSTTDDPKTMDECFELGCCKYVAKPVQHSEFVKMVQQVALYIKQAA